MATQTLTLQELRRFAEANAMELEAIIADVCAASVSGRRGYVLFDGGAHKGWHTRRMLALRGCSTVYAVEADPVMAAKLKATLIPRRHWLNLFRRQPRLVLIEKALQGDPDTKYVHWGSSTSHVGRSSIVAVDSQRTTIWEDNTEIQYRDQIQVEATTIDIILAKVRAPMPFLKLDLEGADLISLRGAERTLQQKRPLVIFENSVFAPQVHGFTIQEMMAYFDQLDYVPMTFIGEPMDEDNWFGFYEAWAVPRELCDWFVPTLQDVVTQRVG